MRIVTIGSLNLDRVYGVGHFVCEGETISAHSFHTFLGGKGFNQSIAAARAGAEVYHAGFIGDDGEVFASALRDNGIHTRYLRQLDGATGHAIIQVTESGENSIIVYGGVNQQVDKSFIDEVLTDFSKGDLLLLQNEVSHVTYAIEAAHRKGMSIALNPSPITETLQSYPIQLLDYLIVNETEGKALTGCSAYDDILDAFSKAYPSLEVILTVGKEGAYYRGQGLTLHHGIFPLPTVDTTGAGDTFCGYYFACISLGRSPKTALRYASAASSLAVSHKGASSSIPHIQEVESFLQTYGTSHSCT